MIFDLGKTLFFPENAYKKAEKAKYEKMKELGYNISWEKYKQLCEKVSKKFKKRYGKTAERHKPGNFMEIFFNLWGKEASKKEMKEIDQAYFDEFTQNMVADEEADSIIDFCSKKGFLVGVITNGNQKMTEKKLAKLKSRESIDKVIYSTESGEKSTLKPFKEFLQETGLSPEKCLMVGDRKDEDMHAKKVGMKTAWIKKQPSEPRGEEIEPDFELNNLTELKKLLKNL
ncbi:MAG: HAD family hydrolase [Candidatus Nanohaloarchaeota archaeon QJJ-9]|nr:HAD family hydrolase [Candidatus Nanohaloarchaeota archaeon QJJ-9]